jgi:hypothetical protein
LKNSEKDVQKPKLSTLFEGAFVIAQLLLNQLLYQTSIHYQNLLQILSANPFLVTQLLAQAMSQSTLPFRM